MGDDKVATSYDDLSIKLAGLDEIVTIEMPCFVNNNSLALQMIGGPQIVQNAIESKEYDPYSICFKPNNIDPLRSGLTSNRISSSGILIRIRRKKINQSSIHIQSDVDPPQIEVLGLVTKKITFPNPSDFQTLETVPRPFLNIEDRSDVKLFIKKSVKKEMPASINSYQTSKRKAIFRYEDPVPIAPYENKSKRRNPTLFNNQFNLIKQLFGWIPIWSRADLEQRLEFKNYKYILGEILPLVAFTYSNGPWRMVWIRYGYDPKIQPEARFLQYLDVRIRSKGEYDSMTQLLAEHVEAAGSGLIEVKLDPIVPDSISTEISTPVCVSNPFSSLQVAVDRSGEHLPKSDSVDEHRGNTYGRNKATTEDTSTILKSGAPSHPTVAYNSTSASDVVGSRKTALRITLFGGELRQQYMCQISSMRDEGLFEFISNLSRRSDCCKSSGWFLQSDLDGIRRRLLFLIQQRIHLFITDLVRNRHPNLYSRTTISIPISNSDDHIGKDVATYESITMEKQGDFSTQYSPVAIPDADEGLCERLADTPQHRFAYMWKIRYFRSADKVAPAVPSTEMGQTADGNNLADIDQAQDATELRGREALDALKTAMRRVFQRNNSDSKSSNGKRIRMPIGKDVAKVGASEEIRNRVDSVASKNPPAFNTNSVPSTSLKQNNISIKTNSLFSERAASRDLNTLLSSLQAFDVFDDVDEDNEDVDDAQEEEDEREEDDDEDNTSDEEDNELQTDNEQIIPKK